MIHLRLDLQKKGMVGLIRKASKGDFDANCQLIAACLTLTEGGEFLPHDEAMDIIDGMSIEDINNAADKLLEAAEVSRKAAVPPMINGR